MVNNLHGNDNGLYSYGNKFSSATGFHDNPDLHRKQQLLVCQSRVPLGIFSLVCDVQLCR